MNNICKQLCENSIDCCDKTNIIDIYAYRILLIAGLVLGRGFYTLYLINREYNMNNTY